MRTRRGTPPPDQDSRQQDLHSITWNHLETCPAHSAYETMTVRQRLVAVGGLAVLAIGIGTDPVQTAVVAIAVLSGFYLLAAFYKFYLAAMALARPRETVVSAEDLQKLRDDDLPVYTILVPLYDEAKVVADLLGAIDKLDYPRSKLDVILLLEEDDLDTLRAVEGVQLGRHIRTLVVPDGRPKGKPRACNYGLLYSLGEYVVIYDAEDRPEPDQLKKVIVAFREAGPTTGCVQAKLNYYNREQNLLTRWFTAEYSTWFDLYLPGLTSTGSPVPLGGTSNHFRVADLRQLGAWDPFNVTEDADLGLRLARAGFATEIINSTTYEEANSHLGNWIRQRSRWLKGYMQTWLVCMRDPWELFQQLRPIGFLSFQVMVLGTILTCFASPLLWILLLAGVFNRSLWIEIVFPPPVVYASSIAFFGGNFFYLFSTMAGCFARGYYEDVKYALLSPAYWMLMSIAAWKAAYQLVRRPHYWEKTRHGLTRT